MDSLDDTSWDVLIAGTGIQQSLLALALSRSGKKILHVDKHDYYGGAEVAFSLQEAEAWAERVGRESKSDCFSDARTWRAAEDASGPTQLSFSRAYSLSLSPQIIYARSALLPLLVSSKVYRQLEFQAVGSWWLYSTTPGEQTSGTDDANGHLSRVPSGREDIFSDQTLDLRSRRALMKFLRFVAEHDQQDDWRDKASVPFPTFLSDEFGLSPDLHMPLLALLHLPERAEDIPTAKALPRIARHLRSIGLFGPGFAAVLPRWGGLAEVAQVACRACAVGGGVYVLGRGLQALDVDDEAVTLDDGEKAEKKCISVTLSGGDKVRAEWVVGCSEDLPSLEQGRRLYSSSDSQITLSRSISIVSSSLSSLFPDIAEGAPPPAVAVAYFASGSLGSDGTDSPVLISVHSSDTGECPAGQSVLYASTATAGERGSQLLDRAVQRLLASVNETAPPSVLWSIHYERRSSSHLSSTSTPEQDSSSSLEQRSAETCDNILEFAPPSFDMAFDDVVLDQVRTAWELIVGDVEGDFLAFGEPGEGAMQTDGNDA